ncbi:MAG: tetratricopeptide repeat protein [bacterium]
MMIGSILLGSILLVGCNKQTSSSTTTIKEAEILYDMGKNQEALDFYNQKLAGNGTDFASYITRGKILVKLGRYDDALNDFYKASKLDTSQETYMLYKGLVTMQSAIDVNALDTLNLSGTTNLDMYTFYKCALLYKLNKTADASTCLDTLLAIDNNNPQGNFLKAMILTKAGKLKDSIKYFDKAEQG